MIPSSSINLVNNNALTLLRNDERENKSDSRIEDSYKRSRDGSPSSSSNESQDLSERNIKKHKVGPQQDSLNSAAVDIRDEDNNVVRCVGIVGEGILKRGRPIEEGKEEGTDGGSSLKKLAPDQSASLSSQSSVTSLEEKNNESLEVEKMQITSAHQNNETLFEFSSDVLAYENGIWASLEEKMSQDPRGDDLIYLVKDTYTGRQKEFLLGFLRRLIAQVKECASTASTPLSIDHLTRNVRITGKDAALREHTMPVAELWEAFETIRLFYTESGIEDSSQGGDLLFESAPISSLQLPLLKALTSLDETHLREKEITFLFELWQQADFLGAPKISSKITQAIGDKIDAFPAEILNDDNTLILMMEISKLAKQTNCQELRKKLGALIQQWFDKAATAPPEQKAEFKKRLSNITEKLAPVALRTTLTPEEIDLISSLTRLDSLICFQIDGIKLKELCKFHAKINHLFIQSSTNFNQDFHLVNSLIHLRELNLRGWENLKNDDLIHLKDLQGLEVLDLSGCVNIDEEGLKNLANLNSLQKIRLGETRIKNLECLDRLPLLKELNLIGCEVPKATITDFLKKKSNWKGTITFPNGRKCEGEWVDGKRTGKGTFTWPDGDKYEGDHVDGKQTGKGTFTWSDGAKYEGDWVDGKQNGKGTFTWPDGSKYEGDYVDDKRTGKGIETFPDGRKLEGNFVDGVFQEPPNPS